MPDKQRPRKGQNKGQNKAQTVFGQQKKLIFNQLFLAGAEGFEPSTKVLETHVLPLHHAPMLSQQNGV